MSRSGTYLALGRGDMRAVKCGRRTLIDAEHALQWLRSQPSSDYPRPQGR